jgi:hypothetical protein
LSSRELTDAELGELRARHAIEAGTISDGSWALPTGFPAPRPVLRAFHRDRLVYLMKRTGERLEVVSALGGGL